MIKSGIKNISLGISYLRVRNPLLFKAASALSMVGGLVADVLQPLAPLAYYLFLASLALLGISFLVWLKLKIESKDKIVPVITTSLVFSIGFGLLLGAQTFWSENNGGALASLDKTGLVSGLQNRILSLEERVDTIEKSGGLIVSPNNASDYVHNARTYRSRADFFNARTSYASIFRTNEATLGFAIEYISYLKENLGTQSAVDALFKEVAWGPDGTGVEEISIGDGMLWLAFCHLFVPDYDARRDIYEQIISASTTGELLYSWAVYFLISDEFSRERTFGYADALKAKELMQSVYGNHIKFFAGVTDVNEPSVPMIDKIEVWNDSLQTLSRAIESRSSLNMFLDQWRYFDFIVNDSVSKFYLKRDGKEIRGALEEIPSDEQGETIFKTKLRFGKWDGFLALPDSGIENVELVYFDRNGLGPFSSTHSLNAKEQVVADVKNQLEGVTHVSDGTFTYEYHHPGIHRLRQEYADYPIRHENWLTPAARSNGAKRRENFTLGITCYSGYWMCGKSSAEHGSYQCGDPWVILSFPNVGGKVYVDFKPLLSKRYAIDEIRFSLGDQSLGRRVNFTKQPLSQIQAIETVEDSWYGLIPGDEHVVRRLRERDKELYDAYLPINLSEGPLNIQIKYLDGSLSQIVSYELIPQIDYNLVNDGSYLPWRVGPSKVNKINYLSGELRYIVRETNGKREGLLQTFYKDGALAAENLYVDGSRLAVVSWHPDGSLATVQAFRECEISDSAKVTPTNSAPSGPRIGLTENGEIDSEFTGYSKYDIRGLPYVSEDKLLDDARPHRDTLTLPIMRELTEDEITKLLATQSALEYWHEIANDDGLIECGVIVNSKREGTWRSFDSEGNLRAEGSYFDNKKKGDWRTWREDGTMSSIRDEDHDADRYGANSTKLFSEEGEISIAFDGPNEEWLSRSRFNTLEDWEDNKRLGGTRIKQYTEEEIKSRLEKWSVTNRWYKQPSLTYSVE